MANTPPLTGICVVEIGHSLAAPYAGMILGALGADIIKVEEANSGDYARDWGPPFVDGASALFHAVNHGKRSVSLSLANSEDVRGLRRLILERADVVLQNLKAGSAEKYGIGPRDLTADKQSLIYCSVGAFGEVGPLRDKPGYDPLVQALSGQMSFIGSPGDGYTRIPISLNDMGTGLWAAIGVLAALARRQTTGKGEIVSVSLYETALSWAGIQIADYLASGILPGRWGSGTAAIVPYQAFECSDVPILVAAGNDRLFQRLCQVLGLPDLINDPRFRTNGARVSNRAALIAPLAEVLRSRPAAHWLSALDDAGIPSGQINTIDKVVAHDQTKALDIIMKTSDGSVQFVGLPISFGGERPNDAGRTPKLGEHNDILEQAKQGAK
ncbi:MAG: CaiB/BaiF CoA transferase family protein [Dongiaceae bacterium]